MTASHRAGLLLLVIGLFTLLTLSGNLPTVPTDRKNPPEEQKQPFLVVLGITQDAGYPQAGCRKDCCAIGWNDHAKQRDPCCAAVVDPKSGKRWLFDCTPSFPRQLQALDRLAPTSRAPGIAGIFLTHAHVGHYTGLIHLGREAMGARLVPVHVMPRMAQFLKSNGPWSLLVKLRNVELQPMTEGKAIPLTPDLSVTPLLVPHRGEYSETVGFRIQGPRHSVLYLPDIDRWSDWGTKIEDVLAQVDRAYLDGTFYSGKELPGRDVSLIPHPSIVTSMNHFSRLPERERNKVHFFHLNHTNPALNPASDASRTIRKNGFHVAEQGERFGL